MDLSRHDEIGAYALGALPPAEAKRFEEHLQQCEDCQVELAELRPVVAALPHATDTVEPPAALRRRIMDVVEADAAARRPEPVSPWRRWVGSLRPLPVAAAACAFLLAGVGLGIALNGNGGEPPREGRTIAADVSVKGASAQLIVNEGEADLVVHGMRPPPEGRVYQVWLKRAGRPPAPTSALFTVNRDGGAEVHVPGKVDDVESVLVTHEPDGGSKEPTRAPVIVAEPA